MKVCPNCHNNIDDSAVFCTVCGAGQSIPQNTQQVPPQQPAQSAQQVPPQPQAQGAQQVPPQPQAQSAQQVPPAYMPPNTPQPNTQVPPQSVPYYATPVQKPVEKFDFTEDFDQSDIAENKLMAMIVYLLGIIGIALAYLKKSDSKYLDFHIKQSLKLVVVEAIVSVVTVVLGFTVIVAIAGGVCLVILAILRIIGFFDVCKGKARVPAIIRSLDFLK
ncbi:MAG: zinc ribbon domain-containing protein [Ruminococcus sp.]|nr:zinc ribbon domain-containing protein [Ruminococcus sp.]